MEKKHFNHFHVAGFTFYDGPVVFEELKIGTPLRLVPEANNTYDGHAVAVYYKEHKIGFVPRNENNALSKLLLLGYDIFDARIQRISPNEQPENQLQVIVYLLPANKTV